MFVYVVGSDPLGLLCYRNFITYLVTYSVLSSIIIYIQLNYLNRHIAVTFVGKKRELAGLVWYGERVVVELGTKESKKS